MSKPEPNLSNARFLQYAGMGMQILATIVIFTLGGRYLDHWLGLKVPVFTLILSLAGVTGAIWLIIRKLK
ncbi:MAG: AtpZ/AtpI family protein [Bacteroidetes bacterium]|nr:AtpZ/AtpI family protein [Bacteroidota bacterium]